MARIRTVEYDPGFGWIARSPFDGRELGGEGFRWRTRHVAQTVVDEERMLPRRAQSEDASRKRGE